MILAGSIGTYLVHNYILQQNNPHRNSFFADCGFLCTKNGPWDFL
jgi:hypothetical protein